MHCIYCNQELPEEAVFCFRCGRPVPEQVRSAASAAQAAPQPQPQAHPNVAAAFTPPPAEAASTGPPQAPTPVYEPVTTDAVAGDNVMSFLTISNVLTIIEPLAADPQRARSLQVDPEVAESLRAKLQNAFDFLADLHKVNDKLGQAMSIMKRATQALSAKSFNIAQLREDPNSWLCTQELTAEEAQLYNLAGQQTELREGLETRVLRVCESCHYQRIYNPDYEKMVANQNRLDTLLMLPRNTLMALARLRRAAPKFVCPRCQGLKASERTIVLCPKCGTPHLDLLLTRCAKCGYDFVARSGGAKQAPDTEEHGEPVAPTPQPTAPPPPSPQKATHHTPTAAAGQEPTRRILAGKCADCGNEFRVPLEKIPPQGLRARCARCGRPLRIRPPERQG